MTAQQRTPQPPHPTDPMPPASRALLRKLNAMVERDLARYPQFAEAVRRRHAAQAEAERAAPSPAADK